MWLVVMELCCKLGWLRGIFRGYAHTGSRRNGKWRQVDRACLSFFSSARNGIFIFGGFELGLEKVLGGQMIGAEWVAAHS